MMEQPTYMELLRRRWLMIVLVPLLVLLLSAAIAALAPARYTTSTRLLVTRAAQAAGTAGLSDRGEDTTAQDVPAIIQSEVFRTDVAAELARQSHSLDTTAIAAALNAGFSDHTVSIIAQADDPAIASALAETVPALLRTNGLRYWGDTTITPAQPGLNIAVLDPATPPTRVNGPRALASQLALRTLLGLAAAIGLATLPATLRPR